MCERKREIEEGVGRAERQVERQRERERKGGERGRQGGVSVTIMPGNQCQIRRTARSVS